VLGCREGTSVPGTCTLVVIPCSVVSFHLAELWLVILYYLKLG
jgi:hypothetical protein